jgi:hypothetical protein
MLWVLLAFHALNLTVRRSGILNHNSIHSELIRGSLTYTYTETAMKYLIIGFFLLPGLLSAANIKQTTTISCISDSSSVNGTHRDSDSSNSADKARSWFSEWLFAENFSEIKSKIKIIWTPRTEKGPSIEIITNEKAHNSIKLRSYTKNSLIVISSASSPFTTESWSFALNFKIETILATRIQSNVGGVKGEILTYNCQFETIDKNSSSSEKAVS